MRGVHRQLPTSRQFMLNGIYPPYDARGSMVDTLIKQKVTKASDGGIASYCSVM